MDKLVEKSRKLFKNKLFNEGAPFLITLLVGAFFLKQARDMKYKYETNRNMDDLPPEEEFKMRKALPLEKAEKHEKEFQKEMSGKIESWYNVRAPRDDEDSKTIQEQLRKEVEEKKNKK